MCTNAARPAVRTPPEVVFGTTSTTGARLSGRRSQHDTAPMPPPGPHEQVISVSYLWGIILTTYLRRFLEARNREIKVVAESDAWRQFVPPASDIEKPP